MPKVDLSLEKLKFKSIPPRLINGAEITFDGTSKKEAIIQHPTYLFRETRFRESIFRKHDYDRNSFITMKKVHYS